MNTKKSPSRIVYKYVEVPYVTAAEEPKIQPPKESLAHRAWANCWLPPTVHFDLPSPISAASASSTSSSRSASTSSSHSSVSSAPSHGFAITSKPLLPVPKTRAYSSPAILTNPTVKSPKPTAAHTTTTPPSVTISSSHPVETSYTTTTTTITTKDGTFVKERKVVSTHGFHDGKGATDWSGLRSPDWEYLLHKKVKGKKVLASYVHCQAW